jgi:transketolase
MRAMPNMRVLSPADHVTAAGMFDQCVSLTGPKYLRLDAQILPVVYEENAPEMARGFHVHRKGRRIGLVATGYMLHTAFKVADALSEQWGEPVGVIDLFDLARFSADELQAELAPYDGIVSLEEGFRGRGGMDSMLFEFLTRRGIRGKLLNLGVDGGYRFELGNRAELHEQVGIGPLAAIAYVQTFAKSLAA